MLNYIDSKLNKITMYRLVMYYLMVILGYVVILSNIGYIAYDSFYIVFSVVYISFFSLISNIFFSRIFKAPVNMESVYITALILSFVITPPQSILDLNFLWFAFLATFLASASKYIFAIRKKHIFNPVAFAILSAGILSGQVASWWIGSIYTAPVIVFLGLFLLKKISRFTMVLSFLVTIVASSFITYPLSSFSDIVGFINKIIFYSPALFFAFIMLTEPLTSPSSKWFRVVYAVIVGFLYNPFVHIGSLYFTPELALMVGNLFTYFVNSKTKALLILKEKIKIAENTYDFIFKRDRNFNFKPGQYMEWTFPHNSMDNRGSRRYFTISSSPSEKDISMGVKFSSNGSSFKRSLIKMKKGDLIVASELSGDFILPKDKNKKLVFLAGGIGITPFRSMIKDILDKKEYRDIVLLYSNNSIKDVAYKDILDEAENFGIKVRYVLASMENVPKNWISETGYIDKEIIKKFIADYSERIFYISGPHSMVVAEEKILNSLGLPKKQIKSDFFPGFV